MYVYEDISKPAEAAIKLLYAYMVIDMLYGLGSLYQEVLTDPPDGSPVHMVILVLAIAVMATFIVTVIVVARWIYRANANSHALKRGLNITPGWAVGWYFIPLANLFKPYQSMREMWVASHDEQSEQASAPPLLKWWWGMWLVTNMLTHYAFRVADADPKLAARVEFTGALINIALCLALISIIRQIGAAQAVTARRPVLA